MSTPLDDGMDRAARLLERRDTGIRLLECLCKDLQDIGAPPDVCWRAWRALRMLTLCESELTTQRKRNRKLERKG